MVGMMVGFVPQLVGMVISLEYTANLIRLGSENYFGSKYKSLEREFHI
jgi:hypothetical protein